MAHVAMLASHIDRNPITAMLPNMILHTPLALVQIARNNTTNLEQDPM